MDLFQSCPEKIISYMWGTHMIPVPYKVRVDHKILHVGDHQIPIPYKVWQTIIVIDSYKVPAFSLRYGGTISHWQLQGFHIPYKVWGPLESLTVTRFLQWTVIMKTLHIDSYKVPEADSNHIVHVGGWCVLAPKDLYFESLACDRYLLTQAVITVLHRCII